MIALFFVLVGLVGESLAHFLNNVSLFSLLELHSDQFLVFIQRKHFSEFVLSLVGGSPKEEPNAETGDHVGEGDANVDEYVAGDECELDGEEDGGEEGGDAVPPVPFDDGEGDDAVEDGVLPGGAERVGRVQDVEVEHLEHPAQRVDHDEGDVDQVV